MNLTDLRNRIDDIDKEILKLFIERMDIAKDVAMFKVENNLPVFQSSREIEIINNVRNNSPEKLKNSSEVLFKNIMDISKYCQEIEIFNNQGNFSYIDFINNNGFSIGCQGVDEAYSHIASKKLFGENNVVFFKTFDEVFEAVENGSIDFGVLPIQNSTAGSVAKTYELLRKYNLYISSSISLKLSHCLATRKGVKIENIKKVYSHEQALWQCSDYLKDNNFDGCAFSNTALSAEYVKNCDENFACICSVDCAKLNGLEILSEDISNADENYTRFICISKKIFIPKNADIISVSLSLPHSSGALYSLLTKFAVAGLNLLRIESKPIASKDFDVVFYLDFAGSIKDENVVKLLTALKNELNYFKFLGNYNEVI